MLVPEKTIKLKYSPEDGSISPSNNSHLLSSLPDSPVIRIRPAAGWRSLELGELWRHREFFYFLIWRDLKTRYKQAALGVVWVVLQPILMTLIFTVFLGALVKVSSDGVPYSIFAYAGLLPWAFFNNSILSSSHSLVGGAPLITKVYFPRLFLPAAAVFVRLVDFCIAAIILFLLLLYYGFDPSLKMLLFPILVLELSLLSLGCGLWAASMNVKYRDIGTLLPVLLQLWMFTSPIVYSSSVVPERWRWVYSLNPLVGIIEGMRACLFNLKLDWVSVGTSAITTMLLLIFSTYSFSSAEESFADIV